MTEIRSNDRGQTTATFDPEGNVTELRYYQERDPDGDGVATLSPFLGVGSEPAGYLESRIADSDLPSPRRMALAPPTSITATYGYDHVGNVTSSRNPRGVVTRVEVNALNEPVVTLRGADVTAARESGQLLTGEGAFRYATRLFYDHNGRVVKKQIENRDSTTAGVGPFVDRTFAYDMFGHLLAATVEVDATTALTTSHRYDANENLTLVQKPAGNQVVIAYDERDLPFTVTRGFGSPEASTVRLDYDRNGNRARVTDAEDNDGDGAGEATTFVYDGFDRLVEAQDALGNRSITAYDVASNAILRQVVGHPAGQPGGSPVLLSDVAFAHDELNRVFRTDAALFLAVGFTTARPVDLRDEDLDGFVTTRFEHDALSRPTFVVEDDGEVRRTVYDGASRAIETVDALGNRLLTAYDQGSNPVVVSSVELSPEGLVPDEVFSTIYVYDQLDRLVRATDNAGQTTRFAYDSRDNLVFRSDPVGPLTADPLGLFPGAINAPGNTKTYFFDGLDRLVLTGCDLREGGHGGQPLDLSNPRNPDGQVRVAQVYDGNSRLTAIVDDNGNRTSFGYDALDRQVAKTYADATGHIYEYDRDDNLILETDPNGSEVTRTYDALHRLIRCQVARAPGVGGTTLETYAYDGLSRLTFASDDNGAPATAEVTERVYDSLSRLLEERQQGAVVSSTYSGDRKRLSLTYPGGRRLDYAHDAIDRVKTIAQGSNLLARWDWIGPGARPLRRLHGNGTALTFLADAGGQDLGYDAVKRIVRLRHVT
ncbi:MAG: hypothetical protein L0206_22820, partial [Actinobacteria bacterium]|nr:hypothetical protein [Actinomycetota bacterium]